MGDLIGIDEARRRVLDAVNPLPAEPVSLNEALGRVLAEDVTSAVDVPPFDTSAMDGYAVASPDGGALRVVGESRAGRPAEVAVETGCAVAISTGAPVPAGAVAVVPVERTEREGDSVRAEAVTAGANIRRAGEDVRTGRTVLGSGTPLGPAELAVMAGVGRSAALCARRPWCAVVATGDELVEPGRPLAPGKIWSTNPLALVGQIAGAGGELVYRRTVADEPGPTRAVLGEALDDADVVCVSGGVSVGAHDHVKGALAELGVTEGFWGVSLKPGKPTWFGTTDRRTGPVLVFGLPGNPVSAMVTFQLFVRPALRALQGADPAPRRATAMLDEPLERNRRRDQAIRCSLRPEQDGWHAVPTGPQDSHMLTSMLGADALAIVPSGEGAVRTGERVQVELLDGAPAS